MHHILEYANQNTVDQRLTFKLLFKGFTSYFF